MANRKQISSIKIQGLSLRDETLELGNHDCHDFIWGGARLENCVLDIRGAGFNLLDATLLNCRIRARRRLSNVRFVETVFENCTFEGSLVGCRFGFRRGESQNPRAYYRNCDFSKARLDLCEFFEGDPDSNIWSSWPNFAVLQPGLNKQDWLSIVFPPELKVIQAVIAGEQLSPDVAQAEPKAVTVDLASYGSVDAESVWALIQNKPYIVFTGKGEKPLLDPLAISAIEEQNRHRVERQTKQSLRLQVWNLVHNGVIEKVERLAENRYAITIDLSFLGKKLDNAPSVVTIELTDCSQFKLQTDHGDEDATSLQAGQFRVLSCVEQDGTIFVKSRRKAIGPLKLCYETFYLKDVQGQPMELMQLSESVARYWMS